MITVQSTQSYVRREAGESGYPLYILTREGFSVASWVVLEAKLFRHFQVTTSIRSRIDEILQPLKSLRRKQLRKALQEAATRIRKLIISTPFPPEIEAEARQAFAHFKGQEVVIRSSISRQGQLQYSSIVNSEQDALLVLKECWATAYSEQSLSDQVRNGVGFKSELDLAVIFQEHQLSEKSGTVRTSDPEMRFPDLNPSERQELREICNRVEKFYRFPQEIEWSLRDGRLTILQVRPVMTAIKSEKGQLWIWDHRLSLESYSGITLPLTFSFARHLDYLFHRKFCEVLFLSRAQILKMDGLFKNLFGIFKGRVYSNLINVYRVHSILPGFQFHRRTLEQFLGIEHDLPDPVLEQFKPRKFRERVSSFFWRFVSGVRLFYLYFSIQSKVDDFLHEFHSIYEFYFRVDYSRLSADEIYGHYQEFESKVVAEWKLPIIYEILGRMYFWIFKNLAVRWMGQDSPSIYNDLLCHLGHLESAEPYQELFRLSTEVKRNPGLAELILNSPAEDCFEKVMQSPYESFKIRVNQVIDLYGFRCVDEMKLEVKDLHQESSYLFWALKNLLKAGQTDLAAYEFRQRKIREKAEELVFTKLNGIKSWIFGHFLDFTRQFIADRESIHFSRARIHGLIRRMFTEIGRDFTHRNVIDRVEDLFFLELEEISGALEGTLATANLRALIEFRKKEYSEYEKCDVPPRFNTRGPVYWMNEYEVPSESNEPDSNILKGIGCSPGVLEGRVRVIDSLQECDSLMSDEILVTFKVDPAWGVVYPLASALLVERGGLLSHSIAVAREMGLPTITGVRGLTRRLKTGMRVRVDGGSGQVEILH